MASRILILIIFVAVCTTIQDSRAEEPIHYDTSNPNKFDDHTYVVKSDSESKIDFDIRISNVADDINCSKGFIYSFDSISKGDDIYRHFDFSRKGSPSIALYEWHMCFIVDGITYKAWRGYDPGPGTVLKVNCWINSEQMSNMNTDLYLCKVGEVTKNHDNFNEYASICRKNEEHCKRFESKNDLELWKKVTTDEELLNKVAFAVISYDILKNSITNSSSTTLFLSVGGENPSSELLNSLKNLDVTIQNGSDWELGKGVQFLISEITTISKTKIEVIVSTYCGSLCASESTVILELLNGKWDVVSSIMNWISIIEDHNEHFQAVSLDYVIFALLPSTQTTTQKPFYTSCG